MVGDFADIKEEDYRNQVEFRVDGHAIQAMLNSLMYPVFHVIPQITPF